MTGERPPQRCSAGIAPRNFLRGAPLAANWADAPHELLLLPGRNCDPIPDILLLNIRRLCFCFFCPIHLFAIACRTLQTAVYCPLYTFIYAEFPGAQSPKINHWRALKETTPLSDTCTCIYAQMHAHVTLAKMRRFPSVWVFCRHKK